MGSQRVRLRRVVDLGRSLRPAWDQHVGRTLAEATLKAPDRNYAQKGGKRGVHSEHLGFILAEMQFLQRAYPDAKW